jgi:hypothetical protein
MNCLISTGEIMVDDEEEVDEKENSNNLGVGRLI